MTRVLVLGVNPFEDVPGYQLLSLLKTKGEFEIIAADDSAPALRILSGSGMHIEAVPDPSEDPRRFTAIVAKICEDRAIDLLLTGTDAHLYALASCLAQAPLLGQLCPTLNWLASKRLMNKVDLQRWASSFAATPNRWPFDDECNAKHFAETFRYPLMVKGLRKGAIKCDDELEAVVARREILRNPANQGVGGGAYAESIIDGEEHSLFLLAGARGDGLQTFGFRKLAVTKLGTTLAGQVDFELPAQIDIKTLLDQLTGPTVLELEWRKDVTGKPWLFEINARFPSWIGALGLHGKRLLEDYIDRVLECPQSSTVLEHEPPHGSIFYRLPQSGFLRLEAAFSAPLGTKPRPAQSRYAPKVPMLWTSTSPHQFRMK